MSVTFRQLEVFVEAAQDCNFRKTADRLGITQPSVSNQLRSLEAWAGYRLFERSRGTTPMLSTEGALLLERARELLACKGKLARAETVRSRSQPFRLRVGAGAYVLDTLIRAALPQFLRLHKGIVPDFLPLSSQKQMRVAVRSGHADIAVYTAGSQVTQSADTEVICEIPCSIYGSARFGRLAGARLKGVSALPFILPLEGSDAERWVLRSLKKHRITPRHISGRSQFADVIGGLVLSGKGVSMLFDEQMAEPLRANRVVRIGPTLPSGWRVLVTGQRARAPAVAPFLDFLREVLRPATADPR